MNRPEQTPSAKPLVAVSFQFEDEISAFSIRSTYLDFLKRADVAPIILLPQENPKDVRAILNRVDGVLIPGGNDVEPALYGKTRTSFKDKPAVERDTFEPLIIRQCIEDDIPFLGICRGFQIANVVCGGTLCQEIGLLPIEHLEHWNFEIRTEVAHRVSPLKGTPIASLFGDKPFGVNSIHHQTIEDIAPDLVVNAMSEDGLIEAISHPNCSFFLGVQWHPEFAVEASFSKPLSDAFGQACKEHMKKRLQK